MHLIKKPKTNHPSNGWSPKVDGARLERETNTGSNHTKIVLGLVYDFVTAIGEYSDMTGKTILESAAEMAFQKDIIIVVMESSESATGSGKEIRVISRHKHRARIQFGRSGIELTH